MSVRYIIQVRDHFVQELFVNQEEGLRAELTTERRDAYEFRDERHSNNIAKALTVCDEHDHVYEVTRTRRRHMVGA